ncbi:putative 4-mercaptohistidine N1-methyltransferase [Puniceicoccaceae bacterium K14]|nr:putative 4-mercaptohistidine N1-methyltransferase [Puniceicoccaceae bacterium K14]
MNENFYETDKAVSEYLLFHYGTENEFYEQGIGAKEALDFASRCGLLHSKIPHGNQKQRALDLGCAVGRATFELSEAFEEVVGIDYAHALIDSAKKVASKEPITIQVTVEGDVTKETTIQAPFSSQPEKITFQQGDAMSLPSSIGTFDFVLMANLIDRLPDPTKCLGDIHKLLNANGVLAITSPYTWMEEYTPKEKWLGGFYKDGEAILSFDSLKEILSPNFQLLEDFNMPFLIREHVRKNQFTVAHTTIWQKKK